MIKRILSILLCCVMLAALLPAAAFAADTAKAIQLGTGSITGWADTKSYDYIYFGSWNNPNAAASGLLKWRVLDDQTNTNGSGLFLLSEVLLEEKIIFNGSSNEWIGSKVQKWCKDFAGDEGAENNVPDAFTKGELNAILRTSAHDLTEDKVFLLSEGEAKLAKYGLDSENARIAYYGTDGRTWWLRTPAARGDGPGAFSVFWNGVIQGINVGQAHATRPAFNLNSSAVLFTSAAEGGKSASGMDSALTAVNDYSGREWKLTLKDSSRDGFSAEQKSLDGRTVTVAYSGALTGENEYISAVVLNNNTVRYYGRIAAVSAADGEVSFTLPDGFSVADSDHLYVFNEQYHGDKQTDYAGEPVELDISIHKHIWSEEWSSNRSYHWRECIGIGDCDITGNTQCGDYGKHVFGDGDTCSTCGYKRTLPLHTHYLCGGTESCTAAGHTETAQTTFSKQIAKDASGNLLLDGEPWNTEDGAPGDFTSSKYYVLSGYDPDGPTTYYLDCDYTAGVPWLIRGDVILCLNGHAITGRSSNAVIFTSAAGANFTLCDCQNTGIITHDKLNTGEKIQGLGVRVRGKSTFNMYGGCITGNRFTPMSGKINGSGVYVERRSTFNMYGGSITGNNDGGVRIFYDSTFTVSGAARITDNWIDGTVNADGRYEQGSNGTAQNVWLEHTATLTVKDLTKGAKIGITSEFGENGLYPYVFSNACDTNYASYFFADDPNAHVEYTAGKQLRLAAGAPSAHIHSWASTWSSDDTHHWHECEADDCDVTDNTQKDGYGGHTGGTATCTAKATCKVCGEKYGEKNPNNHTDAAEWIRTATTHTQKYKCCGAIVVAEENHEWEKGVCTECGYACKHTGGTATCTDAAVCEICGEKYGEKNPNNHTDAAEWIRTATTHTQKYKCCGAIVVAEENHGWENGVCTECGYACKHTGGTATCTDAAVCEICGEKYGEKNPANHSGKLVWTTDKTTHLGSYDCCGATAVAQEVHEWKNGVCTECGYACGHEETNTERRDAKEATHTEDGYTGDIWCKICGKLVQKGTVIPATGYPTCYYRNYTDCKEAWYHEAVDFAVANKLMNGIGGNRFDPDGAMSRAMMVTVLYRMAGSPEVGNASTFVDVPAGQWYSDAIAWAQDNGIVLGVDATHFAPDEFITREQIAAILWRYEKEPAAESKFDGFKDAADISGYAKEAMAWAVNEGIFKGDEGSLKPVAHSTRAEFACVVMRYLGGAYDCKNLEK